MIKTCAHLRLEYLQDGAGYIDYTCKDCGEVIEQFNDATMGR